MSIPTYDALMLPVLKLCAEKVWHVKELSARVSDDLKLTSDEREQLVPSGSRTVIADRVHWAKTYLKHAGLLWQPKRGLVTITDRGKEVLASAPTKLDIAYLKKFGEFVEFLNHAKLPSNVAVVAEPPASIIDARPSATPEEQIAAASLAHDETVRDALLARILEATSTFFEKLIIDLLLAMGYGGSSLDAGEHIGKSGDGGVDGVIREDQLGLDRVYLQAKGYQPGNTVGNEVVQAFVGALMSKGAQKGVLITTSSFTKNAIATAANLGQPRLVLIDGNELTRLMLRFSVGLRISRTVELKKIDLDYFEDEIPE